MILVDTGVLFAAADPTDGDHHACAEFLSSARLASEDMLLPAAIGTDLRQVR